MLGFKGTSRNSNRTWPLLAKYIAATEIMTAENVDNAPGLRSIFSIFLLWIMAMTHYDSSHISYASYNITTLQKIAVSVTSAVNVTWSQY